jgi:hypothetical protein
MYQQNQPNYPAMYQQHQPNYPRLLRPFEERAMNGLRREWAWWTARSVAAM